MVRRILAIGALTVVATGALVVDLAIIFEWVQ